jgi:hypothetical protein
MLVPVTEHRARILLVLRCDTEAAQQREGAKAMVDPVPAELEITRCPPHYWLVELHPDGVEHWRCYHCAAERRCHSEWLETPPSPNPATPL